MAASDLGDRQLTRVLDDGARQSARHLALEGGVVLQVTLTALVATEPAPQPDQRCLRTQDGEIFDLDPPGVVHLGGLEASPRAHHHRAHVLRGHLEPFSLVGDHLDDANAPELDKELLHTRLYCTAELLPLLVSSAPSSVVKRSLDRWSAGSRSAPSYCAPKFALVRWSEALQSELAPRASA